MTKVDFIILILHEKNWHIKTLKNIEVLEDSKWQS